MDEFHRKHVGVRGGVICPCCREADSKVKANRLARRRLARETRQEAEEHGTVTSSTIEAG